MGTEAGWQNDLLKDFPAAGNGSFKLEGKKKSEGFEEGEEWRFPPPDGLNCLENLESRLFVGSGNGDLIEATANKLNSLISKQVLQWMPLFTNSVLC
jgi:hypothetical protein